MKKYKIIYWSATVLLSVMMVFSAYQYLTNPQMKDAFLHLGFPDYFRIELAVAKLLGAILIVLPFLHGTLKQMVYAGFGITFLSAFISHLSVGDSFNYTFMPLLFLGVLAVSYFAWHRLTSENLPA